MVQHNNEHPTTAQLSAYVDQELTADELTLCTAHLQTCQECQATLADLRFTSSLLRGMPQVEVPRSFVLPPNVAVLPETPAHTTTRVPQVSKGQTIIKRTLRAMSTLAAVVGLVFILVGAFTSLPHGGMMNATTAAPSTSQNTAGHAPNLTGHASPDTHATQRAEAGLSPSPTRASSTPVPASTPAAAPTINAGNQSPERQVAAPPPALDLSQPEGRLSLGAVLFILGILGVLGTRRRQPRATH